MSAPAIFNLENKSYPVTIKGCLFKSGWYNILKFPGNATTASIIWMHLRTDYGNLASITSTFLIESAFSLASIANILTVKASDAITKLRIRREKDIFDDYLFALDIFYNANASNYINVIFDAVEKGANIEPVNFESSNNIGSTVCEITI